MTAQDDDTALALFLEQGKTASAHIEIDLLSAIPLEDVVGFTTSNTTLSWQDEGKRHSYRVTGVPVCMVESNEDVVLLTSNGKSVRGGMQFILYVRNGRALVTPPFADRVKPHHLKIESSRFEVSGGGYIGQIGSTVLIYESKGESLIGVVDDRGKIDTCEQSPSHPDRVPI
jgi:hypothetical protein